MEIIIDDIKTNIALSLIQLNKLNEQIQKINFTSSQQVNFKHNEDNSYPIEIEINNHKIHTDRYRLVLQNTFFPKDLLLPEFNAADAEMIDYLEKNRTYFKDIKFDEINNKTLRFIYHELKFRSNAELPFDQTKIKTYIRSLDPECKYFKDLEVYNIHEISISSYKFGPKLFIESKYNNCSSNFDKTMKTLLKNKSEIVITIDMK